MALYLMIARASPAIRLAISGSVALVTMANFPERLWQSQLRRLALLCGFIFMTTLLLADSVPPLLQVGADGRAGRRAGQGASSGGGSGSGAGAGCW